MALVVMGMPWVPAMSRAWRRSGGDLLRQSAVIFLCMLSIASAFVPVHDRRPHWWCVIGGGALAIGVGGLLFLDGLQVGLALGMVPMFGLVYVGMETRRYV